MKKIYVNEAMAEILKRQGSGMTWFVHQGVGFDVNEAAEVVEVTEGVQQILGNATTTQVVQKRIMDVAEPDLEDQVSFKDTNELIAEIKQRHNESVTFDSVLEIVHFELDRKAKEAVHHDVSTTTNLREAKLYADGGSRGNPGPSASGFAILDMDDKIVVKNGLYLGVTTNNQAEYQALKLGMEEARRRNISQLHVFMDSLLVVNQMNGIFQVKNRDLWPIHDSAKQLARQFKQVTFTHVPRELNKIADREVNVALDAHQQTASEGGRA